MKRLISLSLILVMLLAAMAVPGFAATGPDSVFGDGTVLDSDYDGIPDSFDVAPNSNVFTGKMRSGHDKDTTVSFHNGLPEFLFR